ncbi:LysR family transcriptional regulator [Mangrovicoccus sp. HB161399]|uniref:LysR family transcriptional regulator n=1 Tax=Mangrovicoccus sp. HB161399 TaxID=2720392 RepID=UPI0015565A16|nr:LysR family transcriptional regulator [Mangrovicoccus sp. HB161399]
MDRLDRLELFARIVEGGSFARAARELQVARSTATHAINQLEREAGVRLLARTTRHVTPTPEGTEFHRRARAILAEVEDTFGQFAGPGASGHLRIEAPGLLTRTFLVPRLPEFLGRFPGLTISFTQSDRYVDIVREGVDCALRAGHPEDSSLHMRRLGELPEITCASPAYLARHGTPRSVDDLDGHRMVGFVSSRSGAVIPLEFRTGGTTVTRRIPAPVSTDNTDTAAAMAREGLGLIQAPRYRFAEDLAAGTLVEVLAGTPPEPLPLNAIHAGQRMLPRRLEVFLDWAREIFSDAGQILGQSPAPADPQR